MKRLNYLRFLLAGAVLICTAQLLNAQDGSIDTGFGTDGWTTYLRTEKPNTLNDMVLQSDGKIIGVGTWDNGNNDDFIVYRFNTDGSIDATFGDGGSAAAAAGPTFDYGMAVDIQSDGKIIAAGYGINTTNNDAALIRFNVDGTIDETFGNAGVVLTPVGEAQDYINDVKVQYDGKIVAGGYTGAGLEVDAFLLRYLPDGSLDATFGDNGIVIFDFNGSADEFEEIILEGSGSIVAAGYTTNTSTSRRNIAVARFNPDGSVDNSFGTNGRVMEQVDFAATGYTITSYMDGKYLVAGNVNPGSKSGIICLKHDGSLDEAFGNNGIVLNNVGASLQDTPLEMLVQQDGKFIVSNNSYVDNIFKAGVTRYNSDGSIDTNFGNGGFVIASYENFFFRPSGALMQPDGKILIGGDYMNAGVKTVGIVRLNGSSGPVTNVDDKVGTPEGFALSNNYPNPFNPSTIISFDLPVESIVRLRVYDIAGKEVYDSGEESYVSGIFNKQFNAFGLSSGIYFYKLTARGVDGTNFAATKKMALLK